MNQVRTRFCVSVYCLIFCAMSRIQSLSALVIVPLLAGCANHPDTVALTPLPSPAIPEVECILLPSFSETDALMSRDVNLSLRAPRDVELPMRLIAIGVDETTTIRLDSGEEISAKPGESYPCRQFGKSGLELVSASPATGTAVFRRITCESR